MLPKLLWACLACICLSCCAAPCDAAIRYRCRVRYVPVVPVVAVPVAVPVVVPVVPCPGGVCPLPGRVVVRGRVLVVP